MASLLSRSRPRAGLWALLCLCSVCAHAQAETGVPGASAARDVRQDRLEGLRKDDLSRIEPELQHGPVALVEFANMQVDQLPAINIAVPVHASAEQVTRVLSDPAGFPRFMPTLDAVHILAKHDQSIVYDWSFDLTVFHMRGRNVMTVYAAKGGDGVSRVSIDSEEGDLGRGRMLFRVQPQGAQCVMVVSLRLDLRDANFVARQIAKAARSVNRSANIALGFSLALHAREEAERRAGYVSPPSAARELHPPRPDVARLAPLLNRGDLLFFEQRGHALDQIAVVGAIGQRAERVQQVMHDAKAFGGALVPGSKAEVIAQAPGLTTFDWEIALPLVGVSGQMQLRDRGPRMSVEATKGSLHGGRWEFELAALAPEITLVSGWAHFDFSDSTWLLEKLVSADAYLGQGIIGASQVMLLRAIRTRATR